MPKPKILAIVWPKDPTQVGSGSYELTACFPTLGDGVHVSYAIHTHHGDEELLHVGTAIFCDGSCIKHTAHIEDFGEPQHNPSYIRRRVFDTAIKFIYPFF